MTVLKKSIGLAVALAATAMSAGGCATAPKSEPDKRAVRARGNAALVELEAKDPTLGDFLTNAYGYAIFPSVGKAGLLVGGAYGRGEVFEQGEFVGYADITQATIGLQAGGQTFSEIIAFKDKESMDRFKFGKVKFSANASAVALKAGAAKTARYSQGVAIFTNPNGGLMFEASVGGQEFGYVPKDAAGGGPAGGGPATQPVQPGAMNKPDAASDPTMRAQPAARVETAPPATPSDSPPRADPATPAESSIRIEPSAPTTPSTPAPEVSPRMEPATPRSSSAELEGVRPAVPVVSPTTLPASPATQPVETK